MWTRERTDDGNGPTALAVYQKTSDVISLPVRAGVKITQFSSGLSCDTVWGTACQRRNAGRTPNARPYATAYLRKDRCFRHVYVGRPCRFRRVFRRPCSTRAASANWRGRRAAFAPTSVCVRIGKCLRSHYALPPPHPQPASGRIKTRRRANSEICSLNRVLQAGWGVGSGVEKNTKKTLATDIIKNRTGVLPRQTNRLNAERLNTFTTGVRGPFTRVILRQIYPSARIVWCNDDFKRKFWKCFNLFLVSMSMSYENTFHYVFLPLFFFNEFFILRRR